MKKGYIQTYEWVVSLLKERDFAESAARLNLKLAFADVIEVDFLTRHYLIKKDGIEQKSESVEWRPCAEGYDYNLKSVLGYYVLSDATCNPVGDFCPLQSFSHGIFRGEDVAKRDPLATAFGQDYDLFRDAAKLAGMEFESEKSAGQYIWRYNLLPKIPVKLVYYEGDDEFPTKIQVLYDKTAIEFFKFEPLAVLHSCFVSGFASF